MSHKSSYLRRIGVYGYDEVEPVILAAFVHDVEDVDRKRLSSIGPPLQD